METEGPLSDPTPPIPPTPKEGGLESGPSDGPPESTKDNIQPHKKKNHTKLVIVFLVILIVVVAGGTAAFVGKLWPFSQSLPPETVLVKMFTAVSRVKSATYTVELSAATGPRDPGAKPLRGEVNKIDQQLTELQRENKRLSDLALIRQVTAGYYEKNEVYPSSVLDAINIEEIKIRFADALAAGEYGYRTERNGAGFTFQVKLQTDLAINELTDRIAEYEPILQGEEEVPVVSNGVVTVNEKSLPIYVSVGADDASPVPVGLDFSLYQQYLPTEFEFNAKVTGSAQTEEDNTDGKYSGSGSLKLGGALFSANGELIKKGGNLYVRIGEFPSIGFFDLNAIKNKWVAISLQDQLTSYFPQGEEVNTRSKTTAEQIQLLFKITAEEGLATVVEDYGRVKTDNANQYHYRLELDREKFPQFYRRLTSEMESQFGDDAIIKFRESALAYLEGEEFTQYYDALRADTQLEVFIDDKTFIPVRLEVNQRTVPSEKYKKFADKQINSSISYGIENVNEPIIVEVPADTISWDEAQSLVTGQPTETILLTKQIDQIESIRTALRIFRAHTGKYPEQLSELTQRPSEVSKAIVAPEIDVYYPEYQLKKLVEEDKPFISVIPEDVFSKRAYGYQRVNDDFRITYMIQLPPPSSDPVDFGYDPNEYLREQYIEGLNTATKDKQSLEKEPE